MSFGDLFHKPLPNYILSNDKDHQLLYHHQPSTPSSQDYQQQKSISLAIYPQHHFSLYPNQLQPHFTNRASSNSSSSPNSSTNNNTHYNSFTPPKQPQPQQNLTPDSEQLFNDILPTHQHHLNHSAYLFPQAELVNAFPGTPSPTEPAPTNSFDHRSPRSSPLLDITSYSLWPTSNPTPPESKISGTEASLPPPAISNSFYNIKPPVSNDQSHPDSLPPPAPPTSSSAAVPAPYKLIDTKNEIQSKNNFQPEPTPSVAHLHAISENQPATAEETGHNAVEKRYRNNINSHIAALADLVPALHHLRSLPSAATSRRHSSQFIVSTSAIGKIPCGLVDGVKAATKLSKGNILSKSVDYVKHLVRTRSEMQEDVEELKTLIKYRVEGGQILILEWEEKVNAKIPERERARLQDQQSQCEEDLDEEDEKQQSQQLVNNKKRRTTGPGGGRKNTSATIKEAVPTVIDELDIFRQASKPSDHQFGAAAAVPYPTDFMPGGNNFGGQGFHSGGHQNHRFGGVPPSNMLAASMGLSFAAGSAYHYYSYSSGPSYRPPSAAAAAQEACQIITDRRHILTPGFSSVFKAGLNTVSLASIVFVLVLLFRPDFLISFIGVEGRSGHQKEKRRNWAKDIDDGDESEGGEGERKDIGIGCWLREMGVQVLMPTKVDKERLLRVAQVDSLFDPRERSSVLKRILTSLKLYCLIGWTHNPDSSHVALLSLHLRTIIGSHNLLSKKLWDQAQALSTPSTSGYVREALQSPFYEACSLLSASSKDSSGAVSKDPFMRLLERRSELELVGIWSRILVSAMRKTSPIETPTSKLARGFNLDGIDRLPTRVEEAGDAYALQISAAREVVDRSIDRISELGIDTCSPICTLVRLTKGMWALAFSRTQVARDVAGELKDDGASSPAALAYLELVLGERREFDDGTGVQVEMTRLDKLATVTISWFSLRRSHLIVNVLPNQAWYTPEHSPATNITSLLTLESLIKQADGLETLIRAGPVLQTDTALVDGSIKQSTEAVERGESREYDLVRALSDCANGVEVVRKVCKVRLDQKMYPNRNVDI